MSDVRRISGRRPKDFAPCSHSRRFCPLVDKLASNGKPSAVRKPRRCEISGAANRIPILLTCRRGSDQSLCVHADRTAKAGAMQPRPSAGIRFPFERLLSTDGQKRIGWETTERKGLPPNPPGPGRGAGRAGARRGPGRGAARAGARRGPGRGPGLGRSAGLGGHGGTPQRGAPGNEVRTSALLGRLRRIDAPARDAADGVAAEEHRVNHHAHDRGPAANNRGRSEHAHQVHVGESEKDV